MEYSHLTKDLYYFKIDEKKMDDNQKKRIQNDINDYSQRLHELKKANKTADFEDISTITIRRSKIEQWVDEPFFKHTIQDLFVKVGNGQKYILAQVKNVEEDD